MMNSTKHYVISGGFEMERLKNNQFTIYDAQLIIYYCFMYKDHRILELTNKTRKLTEFLINNNVTIIVSESVIHELESKGIGKIIHEYTSTDRPNQIIGLTQRPTLTFEYRLERKVKENFHKMIKSNWLEVRPYSPPKGSIESIMDFFNNIKDKEKLEEFLIKKGRTTPVPSKVDMELIAFSKDIESPLISNDIDIIFFALELYEKKLADKIYGLNDLEIYNN